MSDTNGFDEAQIDIESRLSDQSAKMAEMLLAEKVGCTAKEFRELILSGVNVPQSSMTNNPKLRESASTTKQYKAIEPLREKYDIIKIESIDRLFYKEKNGAEDIEGWDNSKIFRVFPFSRQKEELMDSIEKAHHIRFSDNEAEAAARTMTTATREKRRFLDNTVIQITNNLFWDGAAGILTDNPQGESFRRLFDTDIGDESTIKWTPEQEVEWNEASNEILVRKYYEVALKALEEHKGKFPQYDDTDWMYVDYVAAWADGDYDTYMDLLRAIASCFLKKKPKAGYFLIGNTRNGKSTFTALIRTIFGENNSAKVPLDDLTDGHLNAQLATAVVNAPDEQEDKKMEDQSYFKQMTAHEGLELKVMYSKDPMPITCDFMCFYPMNHMPKWTGSGAEACVKRCWPIFFTHDFSSEDSSTANFNRDTYTPNNMTVLIAMVLALASYHTRHPLEPSKTMEENKGVVEGVTSAASAYRKEFLEHFNGVENMKILIRDYKLWCNDNEMNWGNREDLLSFIRPLIKTWGNGKNRKKINLGDGKKTPCYLFKSWSQEKSNVLHSGYRVPGYVVKPQGVGGPEVEATVADLHGDWRDEKEPPVDGKSILTAIEEQTFRETSSIEANPDQAPPPKPKTSIDWVEEYNKVKADKEV